MISNQIEIRYEHFDINILRTTFREYAVINQRNIISYFLVINKKLNASLSRVYMTDLDANSVLKYFRRKISHTSSHEI